MSLTVWVDADACPTVTRDIILKAAKRTQIPTIFVANRWLQLPKYPSVSAVTVEAGLDVADNHIITHCQTNDLVITADIPLAYQVIQRKAFALNPRGTFYDQSNIGERLAMRNVMDELRSSGQISGGPSALNQKDKQNFANAFDRFLRQYI